MARKNTRKAGRNSVQNVRVVDPLAGGDGLKVDRQLAAIHDSSNHVQVLCSNVDNLNVFSTDLAGIISWSQIKLFDDFTAMVAQFNTYRVRSIRFDIYDIAPAVTGTGVFSTFHDQYTAATQPAFSFVDVVDGSDSSFIPPGTGKISLTWVGHSLNEKGYYDTQPPDESVRNDFGGLRYFVPGGTPAPAKYRVITKAIVDFRGRR